MIKRVLDVFVSLLILKFLLGFLVIERVSGSVHRLCSAIYFKIAVFVSRNVK